MTASDPPKETVLFLVHNGGCYSDFAVLGLFTDKALADNFARSAKGEVEEWPANVPPEKWITCYRSVKRASYKNGLGRFWEKGC